MNLSYLELVDSVGSGDSRRVNTVLNTSQVSTQLSILLPRIIWPAMDDLLDLDNDRVHASWTLLGSIRFNCARYLGIFSQLPHTSPPGPQNLGAHLYVP